MSNNRLWFGYMEAGAKSSPVVIDNRLNTGKDATVYIYNQGRGEILEYRRDIAEPKLRELNEGEKQLVAELETAYKKARNSFNPRGSRVSQVPETGGAKPAAATASRESDFEFGDEGDDDDFIDDSDDSEDEDEDEVEEEY